MTPFPAITLSRTLGSGGFPIGYHVAQALGWRYCDRAILRHTAAALGRTAAEVQGGEGRCGTFLEALFRVVALATPESPFAPPPDPPLYGRQLFAEQSVIMRRLVEHASAVLVGRGGFVALAGRPATLHVHLDADEAFRIQRLVETRRAASVDQARAMIRTSDVERARFIREISGRDWMDPRNFDLVLDSGKEGLAGCEARIIQAARALPVVKAG
jgi:cytidylate kinase